MRLLILVMLAACGTQSDWELPAPEITPETPQLDYKLTCLDLDCKAADEKAHDVVSPTEQYAGCVWYCVEWHGQPKRVSMAFSTIAGCWVEVYYEIEDCQ